MERFFDRFVAQAGTGPNRASAIFIDFQRKGTDPRSLGCDGQLAA